MAAIDPSAEFLRISAHYRRMSDGELLSLARQPSELTPVAQQVLANETSSRGLKVQPDEPAPRPTAPPPDAGDSPYREDRELVDLCTVWSLPDALQVQTLLDRAGIPFSIGPENATGVDAVTSNFAHGLSVRVMQIGLPWARQTMRDYAPANDPNSRASEELDELPVCCPRCQSPEVIFEDLIPEAANAAAPSATRFKWTCASCGHHWEDDGFVKQ